MTFIGLFKKKPARIDNSLKLQIAQTQRDLETAYHNFENVVDPDLIDCYIYEVNAIQHRYKFLLKEVKKLEQFNF